MTCPQKTDVEFSLGVGAPPLRTVDSELGSDLGSWRPSRGSLSQDGLHDCTEHRERVVRMGGVSRWESRNLRQRDLMEYSWSESIFKISRAGIVWPQLSWLSIFPKNPST